MRLRKDLEAFQRQLRGNVAIKSTVAHADQKSEQRVSDDALLRIRDLSKLVGLSAGSIYRKIGEGGFPKPLRIGERSVRWRVGDVRAWLNGLSA
jgi:prophage regulatory protein